MSNEIIEYKKNLETVNNEIKNLRQKISKLKKKIDDISNKKNSTIERLFYYGLFTTCSIFSFLFGTIPAIIIGLGIITANAICFGIACSKKKKLNQEIKMHTNEISLIQERIATLTQEASKNSIAISECSKKDNIQSLTNNNYSQKMSKKSIEYIK